jgi:uncharacterized protein YprB with RNaseH-like and TPR domain
LLKNTFIHISGIGSKTEQFLWSLGILTWEGFLSHEKPILSPDRDSHIRRELEISLFHQDDIQFFLNRLPQPEHWRVFEPFKEKAVFLDIETSGGYQGLDEITVIGLYDGKEVQTFINGRNLEDFEQAITSYSLVITFNGSCFDLPYLRRWFRRLSIPPAHIDLRFLLKKLGLRGGLKAIEKKMGLTRDPAVEGLNGFDAVLLWKAYQWGDPSALDRLILYNTMDIVQLKPLMELTAREMKKKLLSGGLNL